MVDSSPALPGKVLCVRGNYFRVPQPIEGHRCLVSFALDSGALPCVASKV